MKMMRKLLLVGAGVGGVLILAGVVLYKFFPERAFAALTDYQVTSAGMRRDTLTIKGYRIPYYHGGSGPPLVLLHGFADSKLAFLQSSRWLARHYTVYLPDLPGHGDTLHDPGRKYGVDAAVQTLKDFTDALGLGAFNLGGNSLGGHISAAFALAHPERVQKLLLVDPAGLAVDGFLPYMDVAEPMNTEAKYDRFMDTVFVHRPFVPGPFKKILIAQADANFPWLNHMLADLRAGGDYLLGERIRNIKVPTLILWGQGDQILPVKQASVWHTGVPGSTLVVLPECGHAPEYEQPQQTARLLLAFLAGRCSQDDCPTVGP